MSHFIIRTFFKGLSLLTPICLVIYIVYWLIIGTERAAKSVLTMVLPAGFYLPGLGIIALFLGIFFIGLLMYPWVTRKLLQKFDGLLRKFPFVGTVYSSIRDLMDMVGGDMKEKLGQPVMVRIAENGMEILGFLTREESRSLPEGFSREDHVVVYFQMSYQIGGYCCVVPQDLVRPVDMNVEQGLQWVLTAGVSDSRQKRPVSNKEDGNG